MTTLRPESSEEGTVAEAIRLAKLLGFDLGESSAEAAEPWARGQVPPETSSSPSRETVPPLSPSRWPTSDAVIAEDDPAPAPGRIRFDCQTAFPCAQSTFLPIARSAPTARHRDGRDGGTHAHPLAPSSG